MFRRKESYRAAAIHLRRDEFLIQPFHQAETGVSIGASPIVKLTGNASDEELATGLLEALRHTKSGVPHPVDWKGIGQPLYDAAGVKTWSSFVRGALSVSASEADGQLKLIPTHNGGTRDGFQHLNDKAITLPSNSPPEELGAAIREALSRSD